jgi:TolB-like protein/DNA-binding winged helix-turn-helix (wHTH) protein/Tfp pilus assembly protein PilF
MKESAPARIAGSPQYRVGDLTIDTGRQRVTRGDEAIALPKLSYELLMALVRAAPNLSSIDALMVQVWPKLIVSPETVSQRIKLLRDALGDDPRNPRYVEGLRGRGYRLILAVELVPAAELASAEEPKPAESTADSTSAEPPATRAPSSPRLASRWPIWASAGLVVLILGAFAIRTIIESERSQPRTSVEVVAVQPRTVAVLPFESLSADADNEFIAVGMADSVLHELATLPELIVVARSSSFALGKPAPEAREAGRKLGARYLVEGSVQRAGKTLRVNAQLIDATTNRELWSVKIDRSIDDVFAVQDQIAQHVAQRLDVTLHERPAEYANFGTDAYLAFLKGRALIGSRKIDDIDEAMRQFSRAIELAPSFAAAYAELANAKYLRASVNGTFHKDLGKLAPEIKALVDRAIEMDPGAGEAYISRASYEIDMNQAADADADFRKGLELAPNYGSGLRLFAYYLFDQGRIDEALAVIDRARLVDPLAAENHYFKGEVLRLARRGGEESAALYLQALEVAPEFYPAYTRLGQLRFQQGRLAEAIKYGEKSIAIEPKVAWTRERLVWFYVDSGDLAAARDVSRGFGAGSPNISISNALICYRAGDLERAQRLLRSALEDPDSSGDGLAFRFATDAVIDRAVETHDPAPARQLILSRPGLKKDRGTLAVVSDNFPAVAQLATLEHFAGDRALGDDLARRILDFIDQGGDVGLPSTTSYMLAATTALLGRNEKALTQLEQAIASGNRVGWWVWLERNPSFAALRDTQRFRAISIDTHAWLTTQLTLLGQMRIRGEVPPRSAAPVPGGC